MNVPSLLSDIPRIMAPLAHLGGYVGACLVDSNTGAVLAKDGGNELDLDTAAAHNSEVVKAKQRTIQALGLSDSIEDILITLQHQYHLIRPLRERPTLFLYLVLRRAHANLPYARLALLEAEERCLRGT